jgi:hypothetical protein
MLEFIIGRLPDVIPYPFAGRDLFKFVELSATVLGILSAVILYLQSNKRGYTKLFWSAWTLGAAICFVFLFFGYIILFYTVNTPSASFIYFESVLFFLIHFMFVVAVALIILLAPAKLIKFLKSLFGSGPSQPT